MRRVDQRNPLAVTAPVDAEVFHIGSYHWMLGIQLAEADQTDIGEVRLPVRVALRDPRELLQVLSDAEIQL